MHIWITVSSLVNKSSTDKALLFRQIELNWINAPLDDPNDYIGLYLDSQPDDERVLPVSVHKLNGRTSGQIITDYYLPQVDFFNETVSRSVELDDRPSSSFHRFSSRQQPVAERRSGYGRETTTAARWHNNNNNRQQGNEIQRFSNSYAAPAAVERPPPTSMSKLEGYCIGYCIAYHSRNKILARNCLQTNPNWMQESFAYIGSKPLPSLMLPGSHNSGTYPKQLDKTVLQMINKYQLNQDESIFNQLVYGIRHLDLRVGYSKVKHRPERLWIYHDIFRTDVSLNEVLEHVRRFLELTSHEIIIMDFHRFTVGFLNEHLSTQRERHANVIEMLFEKLGNYLVPSYLGQHAPLNEYIALGKRLIVGYADRSTLVSDQHSLFGSLSQDKRQQLIRDVDAIKQDQEDALAAEQLSQNKSDHLAEAQADRRMGSRIYNKLKSLKLISRSFSKRSAEEPSRPPAGEPLRNGRRQQQQQQVMRLSASEGDELAMVSRAALFFPPVRHLWPNKDTLDGLAQYMNETTCRKYFGELRSMMVELTPTVFGAISDKYDGNRRLAQLANRPVTDWIRDRWLHCINIVASDFFLGNDLIRLSIISNRMRGLNHRNVDLSVQSQCRSFRRIEHLLDKSRIPLQFAYQPALSPELEERLGQAAGGGGREEETITHTSSDGNKILLRPLTTGFSFQPRERRESFVDNVSDGFADLFSSFKRLLNL